ncbi:MAG: AmmeMemoRadiSam system protein B [Candidatus Magasanikbacteria bacterium CG_4_10_14_0_8_um_filter_32_14]|uniref:AmmeMemoRadiSam system protein B n=2 Tax=Candidatus Magasanikiibacteriota TaxID=1752731 RepID=A0A2M7RAQ6_9BACT|nr:MAG: AmmeMemoRadiSam system protein B [Candidatus Magasanikbacteria bacterium CG1_02_32_51]PIY93426.1 MAG: AmmeMemoRadiSam system protein B [Candidatus Magasanikbacteria bacterium CG_4_10_14_0_8_um_filter_32_14]
MPVVFATITPHPPILIEGIGKGKKSIINKTVNSLIKIEEDLYISKPDVIVVISPHSDIFDNVFSVNLCENFVSNYEKFGDFSTQNSWTGEIILPYILKEKAYERNIPVQLLTEHKLDHGTSIPLVTLASHLQNIKILPIGNANLEPKSQLEFGQLLYDIFSNSEKRIAIVASADLSHSLNNNSPAGFHKAGQEFDEKIIELLEAHNTVGITQIDSKIIKDSNQCGYNSILILLGCLKNINYTFKNLSYETVLGVGYLTGEFIF